MYAIVRTGGKQYRVEEGRAVTVERLPAAEGETVELRDVLLIADDGEVTVGTPLIEGARVVAHVDGQGRGKKLIVFKYKAKVRTRKKTGHRQALTQLTVQEILRPGQESKTLARPKRRRAAEPEAPVEAEAPAVEAIAEAPLETPARRPRRAPATKAPAAKRPARPRAAAKETAAKRPARKTAATKTAARPRRPATKRKGTE
jgi:large subunit ribosomal protein L21